MKLNPDCIRNILLTVEEFTDFNCSLVYEIYSNSFDKLSSYSHDEIIYHIRQCELSDLLIGVIYYDSGDSIEIDDLSPKGHEFLSNVRSDNIWNSTKSVASKIGEVSLDALVKISSGVLTNLINKQLGY